MQQPMELPAHLVARIAELALPGVAKFLCRDVRAALDPCSAKAIPVRGISSVAQFDWARSAGLEFTSLVRCIFVVTGNVRVMQRALDLDLYSLDADVGADVTACAAFNAGPSLSVLEWAVRSGCALSPHTFVLASLRGHWDVIKWAYDRGLRPSEDDGAYDFAGWSADGGEIRAWMLERGFPVSPYPPHFADRSGV